MVKKLTKTKKSSKVTKKVGSVTKKASLQPETVSKKWEEAPDTIEKDGIIYEKLFDGTQNVSLELDNDSLEKIKTRSRAGLYVNDQEFIRELVRNMIISKKND